jgi:hypothetical protein
VCLGLFVAGVIAVPLFADTRARWLSLALLVIGLGCCCVIGAWFAGVGLLRATLGAARSPWAIVIGVCLFVTHGLLLVYGALGGLMLASGGRGRQLRRFGRVLLPTLRPGGAWSFTRARLEVEGLDRTALAAQWRENARTEHASAAAFARLTLDLMALGAPPDLIASSQRDGLDETRHTQMCLSLATAIDGKEESPAPFPDVRRAGGLPPTRTLALATLAVQSLIDGVLHEGVSARILARLGRSAEPAEVRGVVRALASDEGRHAAHGWDVVLWCVREGGEPVLRALEGAARGLSSTGGVAVVAGAEDGAWERWGVPGGTLAATEYARARRHVMQSVMSFAAERRIALS